jgi:hypothetical protein
LLLLDVPCESVGEAATRYYGEWRSQQEDGQQASHDPGFRPVGGAA